MWTGDCKGQYDACFSASAARGYRRRCAPRPRPPTPHVDQEARCARAISPLGRYGALQSGRRQPCRPPPHTRASVVARACLACGACPRVPPLWPWHPRAYIAPRLRGRPKLPSLSACTDGCPSCVRLSTVSRAYSRQASHWGVRWRTLPATEAQRRTRCQELKLQTI